MTERLWQLGSGGAVWAQMLDISGRMQGSFTALDALAATFSDLIWLGQASGSGSERLCGLLARRQSRPARAEPLDNLLPEVIATASGGSAVAVAVWAAALAEQVGLDSYPVSFPGGLLLAVSEGEQIAFIEPLSASPCTERHLDAMVRATLGSWAKRSPDHSRRPTECEVLGRWLLELRAVLIGAGQWDAALVAVSEHIRMLPDDAYARRDRGYILDQLDCAELACADFERFIKECPADPSSPLLKQRLRQLAGQRLVRH